LQARRKAEEQKGEKAFKPATRKREISQALRLYSAFVSSADNGAVRDI
jgi:dihydroxy-acid dehydratase